MIKSPADRALQLVVDQVNAEFNRLRSQPFAVVSYLLADVPAAGAWAGCVIRVSDEAGGPCLAVSDGTDWRRASDNAVIS